MKKTVIQVASVVILALVLGCSGAESPAEVTQSSTAPAPSGRALPVHDYYDEHLAERMVPLLTEVVSFPTYYENAEAHAAQTQWLEEIAAELGFEFRDAGLMKEITLPGPEGAPVLGLLVHGDVVEVDDHWSFPPFEARVVDGMIQGRGVADDKGPLIQALLAMKALEESGLDRKVTIRLLIGTEEESTGDDIKAYLLENEAPDLSLVLDSNYPLIVGEKAWNALYVLSPIGAPQRGDQPWIVEELDAGLATSIVPDTATITLLWMKGEPAWAPLVERLESQELPEDITLDIAVDGSRLTATTHGLAAHAGSVADGRNALVPLANLFDGELPDGTPAYLLAFAKMAGIDLIGTGLGVAQEDPLWGSYDVNVAKIKPDKDDPSKLELAINVRRIPPMTSPELQDLLEKLVDDFNEEHGSGLEADGFWDNEPLVIDPESPLVARLLDIYERVTGERAEPGVSAGGTYAKRTPNSVAFGSWFPAKPYPGHMVDEVMPVEDLHRSAHIIIEAIVELSGSAEFPELRRSNDDLAN